MKLESYCSQSGPKVLGPGSVQNTVFLHVVASENSDKFTNPAAAAGLTLADVTPETIAQFIPGKRYVITIEEKPATPTAT